VQAARDFVSLASELATGVQLGHDDLERRLVVLRHVVNRNPATVVDDPDRTVRADGDVDGAAVAGQSFVHRVVDHLVHEVMQASVTGGSDVHARPLADRFQAF
jgi:hypothetical protein